MTAAAAACRRCLLPAPAAALLHAAQPAPLGAALQVRGLTRDLGALREALKQEEKKRERLAAHAKACDEARAAAEAQAKQLKYVNT